jgi:hypothetical protein
MEGAEQTAPTRAMAAFYEPVPLPAFTAFPDQAAPPASNNAPPKVKDHEN